MTRYRIHRAYAIVLVAVGIAVGNLAVLLAASIPLALVTQATLARTPDPATLRITRDIRPETPLPGQPIDVTLTVENDGDATIPDLRFVDGVPTELGVTSGTPRGGAPLRPGGTIERAYTIVGDRGVYEFDPVTVRARSFGGVRQAEATLEAEGDGAFECRISVEDVPLAEDTTAYAGQLATDSGGPGVEFYATREYRPGDPVKRIDWRQYAKNGDLATVEYREQRAVHVAVVIDSRPPAHIAPSETLPTGATLCAYAATLAVQVLIQEGHHVSVGALGTPDPVTGGGPPAWVPAEERGSFGAHAAAICNAAATGADSADVTYRLAADGGISDGERLRSLLAPNAQVLFCTPAADDAVTEFVERLRADGHGVTILSPRTAGESIGGRVAAMERAGRLEGMRALGATVVDWEREEQLPVALARTLAQEVR